MNEERLLRGIGLMQERPPRTPDCQAMLDEIDALCGLGAEKSGWSAPHDDESN